MLSSTVKRYEKYGKNLFWSIKNSGDILDKLKARDFNATSLSTYDISTLYTTLPHNLIKDKIIDHIERTFNREGSPYLACNEVGEDCSLINFSAQFIKIISHCKKNGFNINVLQQTAWLVVNPITVGNFAFLFNCTPVGRTSDSMTVPAERLIY